MYFRRTDTNQEIKYLEATCDELRHGLTNYEQLLDEIKKLNFDHASAKEAVIYEIKYEATRKVYHTQRKWIKKYYDSLIVSIKEHKTLQEAKEENDRLITKITSLEKDRNTLLAQVKQKDEEIKNLQQQVNKYIKLWQQYEKKLEAEKARREQLGKNNKSLGAYKGLYNKEKKKTEALKQEIELLNDKIKILEQQLKIQ